MTNVSDLARRYFAAVEAGDREALTAVLAEEIRYRFPGRSSFAATYEGREAVLRYLDRLRELTEGTMQVQVLDVLVGTARAVGLVQASASRNSRSFSWKLAAVLECSHSTIESIEIFYNDQYGVDEFLK